MSDALRVLPLPPDVVTDLARLGDTRTWEAGAMVVSEGEVADCMYLIHEGELRTFIAGEGGRSVELNTMGAGEIFGELMLSGDKRSASVQALTRVRLTRVMQGEVERLVALRPDLAFHLIERLAQRVRVLTATVRGLASVDVYGRLVGLFDALALESGGTRFVPGPLSQQRIAERLGASKAMVNRLLRDLADGGYIELGRERIVLLKKLPPRW